MAADRRPGSGRTGVAGMSGAAGDLIAGYLAELGTGLGVRPAEADLLAGALLLSVVVVAGCTGSPGGRVTTTPTGSTPVRRGFRRGFRLPAPPGLLLCPIRVPGRVWHPALAGQRDRRPRRDGDGACPCPPRQLPGSPDPWPRRPPPRRARPGPPHQHPAHHPGPPEHPAALARETYLNTQTMTCDHAENGPSNPEMRPLA